MALSEGLVPGSEPEKFIKVNGIRKINPEWKKWKASGASSTSSAPTAAPTMANEASALPVITNMNQISQLGEGAQVNATLQETVQKFSTPEMAARVGVSSDGMMDTLSTVFAKYEIPVGLLNKLFLLSEFDLIDIMCDDSYSMDARSQKSGTRWKEMINQIKLFIDVLAYIPSPPIEIGFLNNSQRFTIAKNSGESPQAFLARSEGLIKKAFAKGTCGATPAKEAIDKMLNRSRGKKVISMFFGDGVPNGGDSAVRHICHKIKTRASPQNNPFTFFATTDNDSDVEWMGDVEEVAPFCAAMDDYDSEAVEVRRDQGSLLPYSYGLWLVSCLVGALDPDCLDAMDEEVVFTANTFSELLGYQISNEEYNAYFDEFIKNQRAKRRTSKEDRLKGEYVEKFAGMKEEFRQARVARDLPVVKEFQQKLLAMTPNEPHRGGADDDDCCCVVQ